MRTLPFTLVRSSSRMSSPDILLEWCYRVSATLVQMRKGHRDKRWYGRLSFLLGEFNELFCCYIIVTRDRRGKTLLSLVDPGSATISIVPVLPLLEVRRIAFMAQQHVGCPSRHGSGGSGGGPSCPYFPKEVMALFRQTNIHSSTTLRASRINILLFIQFIFNIFYEDFWWSVCTYGIHYLFRIIFGLLDYYYFYYIHIFLLSYSRFYCSFNILLFSHAYYYIRSVYFLFELDQYVEVQILMQNISLFIYNHSYQLKIVPISSILHSFAYIMTRS